MKQNGREIGRAHNVNGREVRTIMLGTIADTTWRMFVPVMAGALVGYLIDGAAGSRPIGVITGMILGIVLAILLVVQQYRSIAQQPAEKTP